MLTRELIEWADCVVVMENRHRHVIEQRFGGQLGGKRIVSLRIPDRYRFMDPALIALLQDRMAPHFR